MKDVIEAMARSFLVKYEGDGYGSSPEAMRAALSAALERGWKLVPVEPTDAVLYAAHAWLRSWADASAAYRAMIAASPGVK